MDSLLAGINSISNATGISYVNLASFFPVYTLGENVVTGNGAFSIAPVLPFLTLLLVPYILWPFIQIVLETLNLGSTFTGYSSDTTGGYAGYADDEYSYQVGHTLKLFETFICISGCQ